MGSSTTRRIGFALFVGLLALGMVLPGTVAVGVR